MKLSTQSLGFLPRVSHLTAMSALPPKADIRRREWHVRFVPGADVSIRLLKGKIGAGPCGRGGGSAERARVDRKLKLDEFLDVVGNTNRQWSWGWRSQPRGQTSGQFPGPREFRSAAPDPVIQAHADYVISFAARPDGRLRTGNEAERHAIRRERIGNVSKIYMKPLKSEPTIALDSRLSAETRHPSKFGIP